MSPDISLLPEDVRRKEEERKKEKPAPMAAGGLEMHVPASDEESIEVIEVDEGDLSQVLAGEPFVTRLIFQTQAFIENARNKLFHPPDLEPPPKLPPQFFKPPTGGRKGESAQPGAKPEDGKVKARIIPDASASRRVRVIKRVRKPVRVSFLEDEELRLQVDIPRRRFTLVLTSIVFLMLLGGGYGVLWWQGDRATANLADVKAQIADVDARAKEKQEMWTQYKDLEPRLKAVSVLLGTHMNPTKVFYALEQWTVPDVSYSSFTLTPDGRVTLAATAASFESAAQQVVALRDSGIAKDVSAMGYQAMYDETTGVLKTVGFQINMTLAPDLQKAASVAANAF
ncbi:hypothetical protein KJ781_03875 [Patescibacteria group bacterium]|nr:hypothetical protein [Patescibacteria group bacterium]MBU1448654.1 hypothetical protein [Patescibacteria group bacterium]MBU2612953.1 hypothetical protein [Patescibacteria group bacterium]